MSKIALRFMMTGWPYLLASIAVIVQQSTVLDNPSKFLK